MRKTAQGGLVFQTAGCGKVIFKALEKRLILEYMSKLFDRAFWRLFSVFVCILMVSVSILVAVGAYRETKENYAALQMGLEQSRLK